MKPLLNLSTRTYFNRRALRTGLLSAVCALIIWILLGGYLLFRDMSYLASLQEKITVQQEKQAELSSVQGQPANPAMMGKRWQEVAAVNRLLERDSYRWTELLDDLEEQALDGLVISAISPDFKDKTLTITGYARGLWHLRQFIDNLMADTAFKEVYLLKQSNEKVKVQGGQEKEAVAFVISLVQER